MTSEPKVCIVIVNWNKKEYVTDLIESLNAISYRNYDVVVVDNASTDGSVDAIKMFKDVKLICNPENLGGTGGFNTGITFALEQNCYKYIWLLDNDAQVRAITLSELVNVAEADSTVGVAGSMIVNPDIEGMVVELGAFVSWENGAWKPYMRNQLVPAEGLPPFVEVDYVAACSALVRVDAVLQAGIMDERYFLHWDDIDFCLRIGQAGYKIVAVSSSRIYHEVEKGSNPVLAYYDIRNGLLTVAKHLDGMQRIVAIYNIVRGTCKAIIISYFAKFNNMPKLLYSSLTDFIKGNFYRISHNIGPIKNSSDSFPININKITKDYSERILIIPNGSAAQISKVWEHLESSGFKNLYLLIQDDRKGLFSFIPAERIISFDVHRHSAWMFFKLLTQIALGHYKFIVSPTSMVLPYSYAAKNCLYVDPELNSFYESRESRSQAWKLAVSFLAGELMALALLPIAYICSFKYSKRT